MKVLVTGANGFVASRLIPRLLSDGHEVVAGTGPGANKCTWLDGLDRVDALDLSDDDSVERICRSEAEWVVHLAGFSSGADSVANASTAYVVNTVGTARIAETMGRQTHDGRPVRFLFASSGLVYGNSGPTPAAESVPLAPQGPYAASKAAAELALTEIANRTGLDVIISRSFAHTGAGQDQRFVVPAFARRIQEAGRTGTTEVAVGNLDPLRDFLHVEDVVDAYVALLEKGVSGGTYNVASGTGVTIGELFALVARVAGVDVTPAVERSFLREGDTLNSVGDASKLKDMTGWRPRRTLEETVQEVVNAQKN